MNVLEFLTQILVFELFWANLKLFSEIYQKISIVFLQFIPKSYMRELQFLQQFQTSSYFEQLSIFFYIIYATRFNVFLRFFLNHPLDQQSLTEIFDFSFKFAYKSLTYISTLGKNTKTLTDDFCQIYQKLSNVFLQFISKSYEP